MKNIQIIIILAVMIITANVYGQKNCNDAIPLTIFNSTQDYFTENESYWLNFTADSQYFYLALLPTTEIQTIDIITINLYSGNDCGVLFLEKSIDLQLGDSTIETQLTIGSQYYIQIMQAGTYNGYCALYFANSEKLISPMPPCGPLSCIINPNTGFEIITTGLANAINGIIPNDPLFKDPMRKHTEVCNWKNYGGTPQIFEENNSYYLNMWANEQMYEAVYNTFTGSTVVGNGTGLLANHTYTVSFRYREQGAGVDGLKFIIATENPNSSVIENNEIMDYNIDHLPGWNSYSFNFVCNISSNAMILHPYSGHTGGIDIDDVVITEVLPPVTSIDIAQYWGDPCSEFVNLSFILPSTPGIIYTWIIPGNAQITNYNSVNNINVKWNNTGIATITVYGKDANGCIVFQGSRLIDPNPTPCPNSPNTYTFNNTTASQIAMMFGSSTITTNEEININGTIILDDELSFVNCPNINMGFNTKIIFIQPQGPPNAIGYPINITNSTLKGCGCKWDGIFVNDFESYCVVDIKNSNISDAKNAVVSTKNGKIEIYNTKFTDNNKAIWIKQHNPLSFDPFWNPLIPIPSNASIKKCIFERINNNFYSYGIVIDTVYDVTIGDVNDASNFNEFKNLDRAIQSTSSDVNIYNNYFNGYNNYYYTINPPSYLYAEPSTAAIFIKLPYQVSPFPLSNHAIQNIVNIGGVANNQANTFYNQEVGIYVFHTNVNVINNTFTEQRYTAIHLRDLYKADISNNSIIMKTNFLWSTNNLYNSSILAEHSTNYFQVKLNVVDNHIINARTGINLRNLDGFNILGYYCNIIDNSIYFNNMGSNISIGINASNIDYGLIENNLILNNMQFNPLPDMLRGINIGMVTNTTIKRNQMIRLGSGIWGENNLLGTQFYCNDFDHNYQGFWFRPTTTIISDQNGIGNSKYNATDNYWYDEQTVTEAMRRMGGSIVLQGNNPVKWHHRNGFNDLSNIYSPYIPNSWTHSLFTLITPIANVNTAFGCDIIGPYQPPQIDERVGMLGAIVSDTSEYETNPMENEYYAKAFAYRKLDENPGLLSMNLPDDSVYQNFYYYLKTQGIGKFANVGKLISNGQFADAVLLNNAITPANNFETHKKTVNAIYLQTIANNQVFSPADSMTLYNIAGQLPFMGGEAVYSARVMLGLDPANLGLDYAKSPAKQPVINDLTEIVSLFPNPALDFVKLFFTTAIDENTVFELYDINSRILLVQNIPPKTLEYMISLINIKSGIYYCRLSSKNDVLLKSKLIITHK